MEAVAVKAGCLIRPPFIRIVSPPCPAGRRTIHASSDEGASLPGGLDDYDRPLRPMRISGDLARYLDIHEFKDKFDKFKAIFDGSDSWLSKGYLFVMTGERGYGKTSLRQRCGYWMRDECKQADCEIVAVDLSDESWEGVNSDARLDRMRSRVLWEMRGYLEPPDISRIKADSDLENAFWELGEVLRTRGMASDDGRKPIVLVVLLPGYPKPAEIERYCGLIREGMVFIAEIFKLNEIKEITDKISERNGPFGRDGVDVYILPLGALNREDSRLIREWLQGAVENCPSLAGDEFERLANIMLEGKIGPRTFKATVIGAIQYAMRESADEVTWEHFLRHYTEAPRPESE